MQSSRAPIYPQTISNNELIRNEFNPLLRNEPKTQAAITECAKLLYTHNLPAGIMWREFSEWIGGYEYILPKDRIILDELAILSIKKLGWEKFSRLQYTIHSNFSIRTQEELIKWISDYNN